MQNVSGLNNIHPVLWKYVRKNLNRRQNRKATNMELTTQYYHDFAVISCKYCSCKYRCFGASNCSLCLCGLLNMILTRFYKVFFPEVLSSSLPHRTKAELGFVKKIWVIKLEKHQITIDLFFPYGFMEKRKFPVKVFVFFFFLYVEFYEIFFINMIWKWSNKLFLDKTNENRKPITWTECKTE